MTSVAASSTSQSPSSSSSIVVLHVDTSDMRPILKEAFGKNVEIATISSNGSIPAKYLYEGLQNYTEGIVANHGGGGEDDDEDAQRTADGVTAIKKNIGIVLKEILNDNLRTALTPFDRDGDGTIDAEELQQAAKDHQTVLMSRRIIAWFSFALLLFMIIVCGGLSVGIYYIVFSMKDTYVNPSTGLMMVKEPDGSTDSNTAGIFKLPTRTLGQGVTITSQGTMDGRTCYSSDSVANMFVNVATGVTTSLAETNQETDELHIYHLGNSDCDESNIVWSNKDVQLGCVVMVPSLECTNMVRRGRYLSEFADTDTDAMQDRHRSLKEHVANTMVGAAAGGQHGTTIDRNNRNLEDGELSYANALSTGTCTDSEEVLYKFKKYPARKCDYISNLTTEKMKEKCKKNTKPNRGKVYDLCRKTCATVGLGPCKAPKPTQPPTLNPTPEPMTTNPTPVPTFAPSSKPSGGRLDSGGEDCTPCDSTTVIEVSGNDFRKKVTQCIGVVVRLDDINCQDDVPIGCWDTSKVTDMSYAFDGQASFNDSINCWNTARVTNMRNMFRGATDFNQPLKNWNVGSVTRMNEMFAEATNFNQSLNDWNVASVNDMGYMFYRAINFNQCLSSWADKKPPDVCGVRNVVYIFKDSGCPNKDSVETAGPLCQGEDDQCSAPSE